MSSPSTQTTSCVAFIRPQSHCEVCQGSGLGMASGRELCRRAKVRHAGGSVPEPRWGVPGTGQ